MREIKFRAWMIGSERMIQDVGFDSSSSAAHEVCEFMQYTGLKDKNGVEIYDGDILGDGAVVEWFDNLAWDSGGSLHSGFYTKMWANYDSDDITTELSYHNGFDDCKVIGNIHENPELLK